MILDSVGLGHSARGGVLFVHYPYRRDGKETGYGPPFQVAPIPASYWMEPPNEITRERVAIWMRLLDDAS